jgi:hypothetical protein
VRLNQRLDGKMSVELRSASGRSSEFDFMSRIGEDDPASLIVFDDAKLAAATQDVNTHFQQFLPGDARRRKPVWLSPAQSDFPTSALEVKSAILVRTQFNYF